jgi:hypothetical protein
MPLPSSVRVGFSFIGAALFRATWTRYTQSHLSSLFRINRSFTSGHSAATIEYRAESRGTKSAANRCARNTPSNFPPTRSIAARDLVLRTSVCRQTRNTFHVSNANVSIKSFASVFAAVRIAHEASHVYPISHPSGVLRPCCACPTGHAHQSRLKKRVDPITTPSSIRTVAKGAAVPSFFHASAVSTYFSASAFPCGIGLHRYNSFSPADAAASPSTCRGSNGSSRTNFPLNSPVSNLMRPLSHGAAARHKRGIARLFQTRKKQNEAAKRRHRIAQGVSHGYASAKNASPEGGTRGVVGASPRAKLTLVSRSLFAANGPRSRKQNF